MTPCPNQAELERFLGLDPVDQAGSPVETHVNECPSCQDAMQAVLLMPRTMPYAGGPGSRAEQPVAAPPGYRLLGLLGRGGVGEVWQAEQDHPRRLVAIKFLHAGARATTEVRERFRVEAEAAARVRHPNVVQVYDAGVGPDGSPFMVMEHLDGGNLRDKLNGEPWPARQAAMLVAIVARAVGHAHALGVVHRDLKPGNVLVDPAPRRVGDTPDPATAGLGFIPKVADFGLAKVIDLDSALTRTGAVMGTPEYMAPEQAAGWVSRVGPRTDVYALGVVLYELITGRTPFRGESAVATMELIRTEDPVPPHRLNPAVPRDLETICLKCMEKDPRHRYPSADDLAAELDRFTSGMPVRARPVGVIGRAWRWRRRNPVVAAMVAALLVLPLLSAVAAGWVAWRMAEKAHAGDLARLEAEKAARDAEDSKRAADTRARMAGEILEKASNQLQATPAGLSEAEARQRAANNLKQIGQALQNYQGLARQLPTAAILGVSGQNTNNAWGIHILPYIEQNGIYAPVMVPGPAEPRDGTSNTILVGDRRGPTSGTSAPATRPPSVAAPSFPPGGFPFPASGFPAMPVVPGFGSPFGEGMFPPVPAIGFGPAPKPQPRSGKPK